MSNVKSAPKGKSLEDFRGLHDDSFIVPNKFRAALESLGESWEYEKDFIIRAGVNQTQFGRYREQFADFQIEIGGKTKKRVWAGTKAFANKLRERAEG